MRWYLGNVFLARGSSDVKEDPYYQIALPAPSRGFLFFFRFVLACIPTKTCDNQGFECDSIHTRTSFLFLVEVRQISAKKRRLSLAYRPTISANVAVSVGVLDMFTFVFVCHQA